MDIKTFLSHMTVAQREDFAARCKTSIRHLQNVAYGYKPAGESLCINIERESKGQVRCESLRPDVDWAVLRNSTARRPGRREADYADRRTKNLKP